MRKNTKRLIIVFFALLLAVMLFGGTFRYYISPKVMAEYVTSGSFTLQGNILQVKIISPQLISISTPRGFADQLEVTALIGPFPRQVEKDEILLVVNQTALEQALIKADNERISALLALRSFSEGYDGAVKMADEALKKADAAVQKGTNLSAARKEALQKTLASAQLAYQQIAVEGIYMGSTKATLERNYQLLNDQYLGLKSMADNGCAIKSPSRGLCNLIFEINAGSPLPENTALFEVLPADAPYDLLLTTDYKRGSIFEENASIYLTSSDNAADRITLKAAAFTDKETVEISVPAPILTAGELMALTTYQISINSPTYSALAPNSAFVTENTVFCLRNVIRQGRAVYVVQECRVKTLEGNARNTPVTSGLAQGMQVITGWDRPLRDGMEVVLFQ